jgi:hypothetical protein
LPRPSRRARPDSLRDFGKPPCWRIRPVPPCRMSRSCSPNYGSRRCC